MINLKIYIILVKINEKMKKKLSVGDVFAIKIEDTNSYFFGRVLFDVKEQYTREADSLNYLDWHGKSVLVETYKHISENIDINTYHIAVDAEFIPKAHLLDENITIINNIPVNPKKVSFPEALKNVHREGVLFVTGELAIKTPFTLEYADEIKVFPAMGGVYALQTATLDYSGRRDLIEDEKEDIYDYFRFSDIRSIQKERNEI